MHNHGMQSQWLLLAIALTMLSAAAVAEQSRAAPGEQTPVVETDNRPPSGTGCGGWGSLAYRACMPVGACQSSDFPAESGLVLYDRIEAQAEQAMAAACATLDCRVDERRNDENHMSCAGSRTLCMTRSLEYRCAGSRPARRQAEGDTPKSGVKAVQPLAIVAAPSEPADLALYGPIHLGDRQVPWGEIVALGPDSAIVSDDGRCRFEYRYQVMNQGEGAAGKHMNRLTRGEESVAAENSIEVLPPGQVRTQSGHMTLWSGEHVIYVQLDAEKQVAETDTSNNLRRIRADVADGCADPRPQARPPGGSTRHIDPPPGRHNPPEPRSGTRAAPPEPTGSRAPVPQGKPAPGTSKPVPEDAPDCRPMLSATRTTALTQAGARATAVTAWEAAALAMYGNGFRWVAARDQSTECSFQVGWRCTAKARPCRP